MHIGKKQFSMMNSQILNKSSLEIVTKDLKWFGLGWIRDFRSGGYFNMDSDI